MPATFTLAGNGHNYDNQGGWVAGFRLRPSNKRPEDVAVLEIDGIHVDEEQQSRRVLLVRNNHDGTLTVRLLDGDPSEPSSSNVTQAVATLDIDELT